MKARELQGKDGKYPAYAWPGGYPLYYVTHDSFILCASCMDKMCEDDLEVASNIHWEGEPLVCEECNKEIESAYGDPDEKETE